MRDSHSDVVSAFKCEITEQGLALNMYFFCATFAVKVLPLSD